MDSTRFYDDFVRIHLFLQLNFGLFLTDFLIEFSADFAAVPAGKSWLAQEFSKQIKEQSGFIC